MSEAWKVLSAEEIDSYKARAEEAKKEAHKEWIRGEALREEV